jgi:hypothetical protein
VYRGWWNGRDVAILHLRTATCGTEANIFTLLGRHPHLVTFHGAAEFQGKQMLLTELVPLGSLDHVVDKHATVLRANPELWKGMVLEILAQVCSGMARIAEADVLHRDLALRNILADTFDATIGRVHVKVSDFGLSKQGQYYYAGGNAVPVRWTAPEALGNRNKFSTKSDVYSLGVVSWELLCFAQRMPYWEVQDDERLTVELVEDTRRLKKPQDGDDGIWAIAQRCLRHEASVRPSFDDLRVELRHKLMEHRLAKQQQQSEPSARKLPMTLAVGKPFFWMLLAGFLVLAAGAATIILGTSQTASFVVAMCVSVLCAAPFLWQDDEFMARAFMLQVSIFWWRMDTAYIVKGMQKHRGKSKVQEYGSWALANLAENNPKAQVLIASKGGIQAIVEGMGHHRGHAWAQEQGCRAIRNLAMSANENRVSIAENGGIEALVAALGGHRWSANVQKWGCWGIANLAYDNPGNQQKIADKGGVEAVFAAMKEHGRVAAVQQSCFCALAHLCLTDTIRVSIAQKGGIESVFSGMWEHRGIATLQEYGFLALANLAANNAANQEDIAEKGGIEALVAGMQEHAGNAKLQEMGCGALMHIGWSHKVQQERIKAAGGEGCIRKAMEAPGATPLTKQIGKAMLGRLALCGT